jgi:hypothetical protein
MEAFDRDELPSEVERWTVKLPTRIEFEHVTIRVMKSVPKQTSREKEIDLVRNLTFF